MEVVPGEPTVSRTHRRRHADVPETGSGLIPSRAQDGRSSGRRGIDRHVSCLVAARRRPWSIVLATISLAVLPAACGTTTHASQNLDGFGPVALRLGYLPNITHAPALIGVSKGYFKAALASNVALTTQTFNAGPTEVEAIFGGALDAAFIGPSPAINAYIKSQGRAIRIVAGAASGGASLVVRPAANISSPSDLKGKILATPQLGNTQDVALRAYLLDHGIHTDADGGGEAKIVPTDNATTLQLFQQGKIDGAWVPEPWAARLVQEAGGKVLVDERSLWTGGQFATTDLVVARSFLDAHADVVRALITGELKAIDWIQNHQAEARAAVNEALLALTQKKLKTSVLDASWTELSFGVDPLAFTLKREAENARRVGLLKTTDLKDILDLRLLNQVLDSSGRPRVGAGGLGQA
jgi:NitT/TauT family transport system substrate-binding protein